MMRGTAIILAGSLAASSVAGATPVQPGFFYHEPSGTSLQLEDIRSGKICNNAQGAASVCETAQKIVITGEESCEYSPGTFYPCTRYGYEFDFRDAAPGTSIDCTMQRTDPMGRRDTSSYSHELGGRDGRIIRTGYRTYAPVEERMIFSEVHDCTYQSQRLATIEYIIYYEPESTAGPGDSGQLADSYFPEVPPACGAPHLSEDKAMGLLGANPVKPSAANEHVPNLQSQCIYSSRQGPSRQVGFVYKFMLSDMFDVDKLSMQQLTFNATFASGGATLTETQPELGDLAFVFEKGDRTTLLVITGIKGRKDFAERDQEFIANYYLDHPGLTHDQRKGLMIDQAQLDLRAWGQ